ncbi:hypothetical protein ONR57_07190 [Hoyosella sp. YIM 151337]|uniref:hypothetical protein n=1 Tax=Hoyosella sp. YIM 151337 TaxID=2992742 RepID=UPI002236AC48|nr:hypothetical protein [Hoyosella sp. YIM 151337]MCW4353079.1 hypothetical protein [Hoyosella sp. YIM 151337]
MTHPDDHADDGPPRFERSGDSAGGTRPYDWRRDEPLRKDTPASANPARPEKTPHHDERKPPYVGGKPWRGVAFLAIFFIAAAILVAWLYTGFTP